MAVDVDWDVAELTRSFIDTNWDNHPRATGAAKPRTLEPRGTTASVRSAGSAIAASGPSTHSTPR